VAVRVLEEAMGPSKLTELYRAWSAKYLAAPPGASFTGEIVLAEK
jgi:hypothetical protein